jgi:hypothetical protein
MMQKLLWTTGVLLLLGCAGTPVIETTLVAGRNVQEFVLLSDSVEIGRLRLARKELSGETRDLLIQEVERDVRVPGGDSIEASVRYVSESEGRLISFDYVEVRGADTLRVTGTAGADAMHLVTVERGDRETRSVPIDEDVRFRLPFDRLAYQDALKVDASFEYRLFHPASGRVVTRRVTVTGIDTLSVAGRILELFRVETADPEGIEPEDHLWVDVFGDIWRGEIEIDGVPLLFERTGRPRKNRE